MYIYPHKSEWENEYINESKDSYQRDKQYFYQQLHAMRLQKTD